MTTNEIKTWDKNGIQNKSDILKAEQTGLEDRNLPATTYEAIVAGVEVNPEAEAISYFLQADQYDHAVSFSFSEVLARINQTANALRRLGIGRKDVVAYVLPNLPETHFTIWGGSAAGRVLAINPLLESSQIVDLMNTAEVKVVVTLGKTEQSGIWENMLSAAASVESLETILVCDVLSKYTPRDGLKPDASKVEFPTHCIDVCDFYAEINAENSEDLNFELPESSDVSTLLCTGGTTGLPKIAMRTHGSEVFDSWSIAGFNPSLAKTGNTLLCGLPLFHSNAILVTGLLPLMTGLRILIATPNGYRGEHVMANLWKIIDHFQVSTFSGVPTIYSALLEVPREGLDTSSVQFGACGAAPMPVDLYNRFVEQTGIPIVEGYGLTEGAVISSLNPANTDNPRIGSIGMRIPYQDMRCAIFDTDDTFVRWADEDEVGVILITGPNVFAGYMIESQNQDAFCEIDNKTWFNTGDLARQDCDGYFWMTGRKKELIIRGGHNIDPKTIEEAMQQHPAIAMTAAVGRPDKRVGEVPVLYYQLLPDTRISNDDLLVYAQQNISERAAIPKDFVGLDSLPVTDVGKIHKVTLNMWEIERTIRDAAKQVDAQIKELNVVQDKQRGIVAKLAISNGLEAIKEELGSYTFKIDYIV